MAFKTVMLMRHLETDYEDEAVERAGPWQLDAHLVADAAANFEPFRQTQLAARKFKICWHSPVLRACESAAIALPNASWNVCHTLAPRLPNVHDALFLEDDDKTSVSARIEALFTLYPELLEVEMDQISKAVHSALQCIEPGQSALLISHKPLVDLATRWFRPNDLKSIGLQQGEAYHFSFDQSNVCVGVLHLALPNQ